MSIFKVLKKECLVDSEYMKVYKEQLETSKGAIIDEYYTVKKKDCVVIVATSINEEIICLNEYKYGAKEYLNTLPSGHIDNDEDPVTAGVRELREETGFEGGHAKYLGYIHEYASQDLNKVHIVYISGAQKKTEPMEDGTVDIVMKLIRSADLKKEISEGGWKSSSSLAALTLAGVL